MEDMVKAATEFKEGEEKQKLVKHIANLLKTSYLQWNRDSVNDQLIIKQLEELSNGKLTITADQFRETSDILRTFKKKKTNNNKNYSKNKNRRKDYGGF
jgi:phosphoenolpyruvate carboxylase